jgi:ribosome biogenesis SPOUT family RNA methylase Rps3
VGRRGKERVRERTYSNAHPSKVFGKGRAVGDVNLKRDEAWRTSDGFSEGTELSVIKRVTTREEELTPGSMVITLPLTRLLSFDWEGVS